MLLASPRRAVATVALVLLAGAGLPVALAAGPAQAALSCAADDFEAADAGQGAPIAVGGSVTRAVCQDRTTGADVDYFAFDAVGGRAYSAAVTAGGSALNVGTLDGIDVAGVFRVGADGSRTVVEAPNAESYERFTTPVLAAGRYLFVTAVNDQVAYPDNYLGLKPVEGAAGAYTVKLTEAAPAPSVASLSVPRLESQKNATGSYTLSGPASAGGISLFFLTSDGYVSVPRVWVPAGATKGSFAISVGRFPNGGTVTITADTRVGSPVSATVAVKK